MGGVDRIIRVIDHKYEADDNRRGAVGVGGARRFRFKVIGIGKGDLNFIHGRPWETNAKVDAKEDISSLVQKVIPIIATRKEAAAPASPSPPSPPGNNGTISDLKRDYDEHN